MTTKWKWAVSLAVALVVMWTCHSWVSSVEVGKTWVPEASREAAPIALTSVSSTLTDISVWRFCDRVLMGTTTPAEVAAIYRLNDEELRRDRAYALRVVGLVRRGIDQPEESLAAIAAG